MKNLLKTKRAEGFTIIEVMIVLAIAGLIMVIVFIAVPQLQRNQRDNARQNIANRTKAEIETYAGNNQGLYPFGTSAAAPAAGTGSWNDFVTKYINSAPASNACNSGTVKVKVCDPSTGLNTVYDGSTSTGQPRGFGTAPCTATPTATVAGSFYVCYGAKCNGENLASSGTAVVNTRTYAVIMGLDRTGSDYCVDNG